MPFSTCFELLHNRKGRICQLILVLSQRWGQFIHERYKDFFSVTGHAEVDHVHQLTFCLVLFGVLLRRVFLSAKEALTPVEGFAVLTAPTQVGREFWWILQISSLSQLALLLGAEHLTGLPPTESHLDQNQ